MFITRSARVHARAHWALASTPSSAAPCRATCGPPSELSSVRTLIRSLCVSASVGYTRVSRKSTQISQEHKLLRITFYRCFGNLWHTLYSCLVFPPSAIWSRKRWPVEIVTKSSRSLFKFMNTYIRLTTTNTVFEYQIVPMYNTITEVLFPLRTYPIRIIFLKYKKRLI